MILSKRALPSRCFRGVVSETRKSQRRLGTQLSSTSSFLETNHRTAAPSATRKTWKSALSLSLVATPLRFSSTSTEDTELNTRDLPQPQVSRDGSTVQVFFGHDDQSIFHAPWLWENDPAFIHPSSGQRTRGGSFCLRVKIQSASLVTATSLCPSFVHARPPLGCFHPTGSVYTIGNNNNNTTQVKYAGLLLRIEWNDLDAVAGLSYYDVAWLNRCRYDQNAISTRRNASTINKNNALHGGERLFDADFSSFMSTDNDDETLYTILSAIIDKGAAMLPHAPALYQQDGITVAAVAQRLGGYLSHGQLYGDTFDVQSKPDAHNIAYTTVGLEPHQDLAYYESPPGLQLLHCIKNSVEGGESKLIDALAAANEFRSLCPDLFDVLRDNEATFMKQRQGADMMYRRAHIRVDSNGDVVSVHWSPPFEGPLLIAPEKVKDYYVARAAFNRMLDKRLPSDRRLIPMIDESKEAELQDYAQTFTWEQRLEPGEIMIFNNERMLHARNAFEMGSNGERHLSGCYTNIDDTMNIYRMLRRKRLVKDESLPLWLSGNGSSSVM